MVSVVVGATREITGDDGDDWGEGTSRENLRGGSGGEGQRCGHLENRSGPEKRGVVLKELSFPIAVSPGSQLVAKNTAKILDNSWLEVPLLMI